ncbi:XRE family transcriptional regulator [Denitromonas sp.]|uniref:helix-turn-helix domain-containing protein n=1 Tax=Denitromonas sp. TaxID=2734609 RepID=UPI002AFDE0F4|nr:XRE family transcriptional regulator [Denitromonas sp.]
MKAPKLQIQDGVDARRVRTKLRLNQAEFWGPLNVTQSGGSRYESGRDMPGSVKLLVNIVHGTPRQAERLVSYLRTKE